MPADLVILASYLPGEGYLTSEKYGVKPILCEDDFDYWQGLAAWWDSDFTIVNVEHDLEWSDSEIAALAACPHSLCSWNYRCHWASSGQVNGVLPHTLNDKFIEPGDELADWSAIGLIKIAPEARIAPLPKEPWNRVEWAIDEAVMKPWHIHGPELPHHHW